MFANMPMQLVTPARVISLGGARRLARGRARLFPGRLTLVKPPRPPWEHHYSRRKDSINRLTRSQRVKVLPIVAAAAAVFAFSTANAAPDADAANKILKDQGCTKCHSVDKDKKGPAFKKVASSMKGKADAEA